MDAPFARSTFVVGLIALAGAAVAFGCSAGNSDGGAEPTGTPATGGSGGDGTGGGAGGAQGGAGGSLISQGGTGGIQECASSEAEAELIDLDIVILLDRSTSMNTANKWGGSVAAINEFVNAPASLGINAGIAYFPAPSFAGSCSGTCEVSAYTTLEVPLGAIGQGEVNAGLISSSMAALTPATGCNTPTYGGLNGALSHATAYQDANPDHKVIVVLASDGQPNGCGANDQSSALAGIAASAYNYNGVETYVIAISGSNVGILNDIAAGGGTGQAFDVTADVTQFAAKMEEIRAAALACEFNIPDPPAGETLNTALVNVQYTPGGSTSAQVFPKKDSAADCGAGPGWYYDNNTAPTKILLCPGSCTSVQADAEAQVKVVFGCESIAD